MDDDLTRRLRALGTEPVPPSTSASHLASMSAVGAPPDRRRFGRMAVGLAALTGFLVGGSGLAMAGALPAPAQDAAADVLAQVGLEAPRPASRAYGQCVSAAARAHGDEAAERQEGDDSAFKAAKEACGEPGGGRGVGKGKGPKEGKGPQSTPKALDDDPCTGPPPWAGRVTKAERDAAKADDTCPTRVADADDDGAAGAGEPQGG